MIPFGKWQPDATFYNQQALVTASGVLPSADGYRPYPSLSPFTDALPARVRGAIMVRGGDGTLAVFAGTAATLQKYNKSSTGWDDISDTTYSNDPDSYWSMAQFGTKVLMTNGIDSLREYDFTTSPSTASIVSGSPPVATGIIVVKDHVVLLGLDGEENALQWSAINDYTGWTIGTNLCDKQVFPDGGRIIGGVGGEYGVIFQERKIRLMRQAPGSPEIFQFEDLETSRGCAAPRSIVPVGGSVFFLANDGFYVVTGNAARAISDEVVWRWFQDNAYSSMISRVVGGVSYQRKLVKWAFISNDASSSDIENYVSDRILIYHWPTGRWSYSNERATSFVDANIGHITLEELDSYGTLDSLPYSLDSAAYNTDELQSILWAFDENHKMGAFDGSNQEAVFEMKNVHVAMPHRALIRGVMPVTDASGAEVAVSARERIADAESYNSYVAIEANGWSPQHVSGRVHSVKVRIPSGETWTKAIGMHVDAIQDGLY